MRHMEAIVGMILFGVFIITILLIALVGHIKKVQENEEFSTICFLMIFIISTYEVIIYFLRKGRVNYDQLLRLVFPGFEVAMHFMDKRFRRATNEDARSNHDISSENKYEIEFQTPQTIHNSRNFF